MSLAETKLIVSGITCSHCRDLFKKKTADPAFLFSVHLFVTHVCSLKKKEDLFKLNLIFIKLAQDITMISICPQHNQSYFKKEFFIQELKHTTTFP